MSSLKVARYKSLDVPRQVGEVGRIRVIKGPDTGTTYILKSSSVVMGRGEEVDLVLTDTKASRTHAKLEYTTAGWTMTDLGSANGIFYQGEYVRQCKLSSNEHFTIGETILEFMTHTESTRVLMAPPRPAQAVVQQDRALSAQKLRVQSISQGPQVVNRNAAIKKEDPKKLILYALLLAAVYFWDDIMGENAPAPRPKQKAEQKNGQSKDQSLATYLPPGVGKDAAKSAEQSYWEGFREYREGHYLRAKEHFELALQVNPSHELSRFYLRSAEKEIQDEIKRMLAAAQKSIVAGRLREAKGYYETAMRAMYHDRSNPDYIESEEAVKKINEMLGRTPAGEVKP